MQGKKRTLIFTLVLSLGMLAANVEGDDSPPSIAPQRGSSPAILQPGTGIPQYYFQLACLNCQNGDQGLAAGGIRRGVELLRKEAKHATKNGKVALERSIGELEVLADRIAEGTVSSVEEVKATFARSQYALAYHHQQRAAESRMRKNFRQAGHDLRAAADNVTHGLAWAGEGVQTKSRDVMAATRDLGGSLVGGVKIDAQKIDAQSKALGLEIKRFGLKVLHPVRR